MFRAERVANTYLDLQDKSRAYDKHTCALNTIKRYPISTQPPIAQGVLIYSRRRDREREFARKIDKKNTESIGNFWKNASCFRISLDFKRNSHVPVASNRPSSQNRSSWVSNLRNVESNFPNVSETTWSKQRILIDLSQPLHRDRRNRRSNNSKSVKNTLLIPPKKLKPMELEKVSDEPHVHREINIKTLNTNDEPRDCEPEKKESSDIYSFQSQNDSCVQLEATESKPAPFLTHIESHVDMLPEDHNNTVSQEESNLDESLEFYAELERARDGYHSEVNKCFPIKGYSIHDATGRMKFLTIE